MTRREVLAGLGVLTAVPDELRGVDSAELANLEPGDYLMVVTAPGDWDQDQQRVAAEMLNEFLASFADRGIWIRPIWKPPEVAVALHRLEER